jgi:hypothetical protein
MFNPVELQASNFLPSKTTCECICTLNREIIIVIIIRHRNSFNDSWDKHISYHARSTVNPTLGNLVHQDQVL